MSTEQVPAGSIVVGIDGSEGAAAALDWAAAQAVAAQRALVVVHAASYPGTTNGAWLLSMGIDQSLVQQQLQTGAHAVLDAAVARLSQVHPDLEVHPVVRLLDPREALLALGEHAHLLVVGSRGLGPMRTFLLGSVSTALSKHAPCPVVVVRTPATAPRHGGVLVAVEGREGDAAVLEVAFEVAAARGWPVTALHCFWDVVRVSQGAEDVPDDEPGVEAERAVLEAAVAPLRARFPAVPVTLQLTRGFVDARLVAASATVDLLVLGHRPKPLLDEVVIGSVAPVVVEHARTTVAVVPLPAG